MQIKERNIVTQVVLTLVTCSFYALYWGFCVGKEAVNFANPEDEGTLEAILCALFPFIGCFLAEKKFAAACAEKGIEHEDRSIMYLIIGLIPYGYIVDLAMMQSDLNKLA